MSKFRRKVFKNTFFLAASQILGKLLTFVFIIYAYRYLGEAVFGKYNFVNSFTSFFFLISIFGLTNLQLREIPRSPEKASLYLSNILLIRLVLIISTTLILLGLTYFLPYDPETLVSLRIFSLSIAFQTLTFTFIDNFVALEKSFYFALTLTLNHLILSLVGIFLMVKGYGLIALSWLWFASWFLTTLLGFFLLNRYGFPFLFQPDFQVAKWLIKEAWPFVLSSLIFMLFFKVDTVLLFSIKGAAQTGWYTAGYRIIEAIAFLPQSLMLAIFPSLSRFYRENKETMEEVAKKGLRYLSIISFPLAVGGFVLSSSLMSFLYQKSADLIAAAFSILIFSFPFLSLREGTIHILNSQNRQKTNFYIDLTGLIFNLALNLILIPRYGFIGAAWATFLSYLGVVILSGASLKIKFEIKDALHSFLKPFLAAFTMGILLYWLRLSFHVLVLVFFGALSYFLFLWFFRGFEWEEISFILTDLVKRKKV